YPASTLPQIIKIFIEKNAESIAISSWLTMILFALAWMVYGTVHKQWPIVISNFLWIVSYVAVVGGYMLYG
ncbi:MAG: SemiSWEET family transporter, partial [Patescibacteria group bacterium]